MLQSFATDCGSEGQNKIKKINNSKNKTKKQTNKKKCDYVFHTVFELAWSQSRNSYIVPGLASVVPQSQLHKCVKTVKLISFLPHNQGK